MNELYFDEDFDIAVEVLCASFDCNPIDILKCFEGNFLSEEDISNLVENLSYLNKKIK